MYLINCQAKIFIIYNEYDVLHYTPYTEFGLSFTTCSYV